MSDPHDLDSHLLRAFVTVAEIGSVTGAADKLARTQAAVSMQLRKLEDALQNKLLIRSTSGVSLTEAGAKLLPFARQILGTSEAARRALGGLEVGGRVRLGLVEELAVGGLSDRLAAFATSYPDILFEIVVDDGAALQERLAEGRLDLVAVERRDRRRKAFASWTRALRWVAAPGYALPANVLPLVLLERAGADPWKEALLASLDQAGFSVRVVVLTRSLIALLATVNAGLGLAVVADRVAIAHGLRPAPASWSLPPIGDIEYALLTIPFTSTDPAAMALAEFLSETLSR